MTSFPAANDAPQDVVMMAPLDGDALRDVAQSGDSRHDDARNADVLVDRAPNDAVLNGEPEDGGPLDTVVIGAGHAGLTMAYYLRRMGQRFVWVSWVDPRALPRDRACRQLPVSHGRGRDR